MAEAQTSDREAVHKKVTTIYEYQMGEKMVFVSSDMTIAGMERALIMYAVQVSKDHGEAVRRLGISKKTLYRKLKQYREERIDKHDG